MNRRSLLAAVFALAASSAPLALADGLPVVGVDVGNSGVASADGQFRFVTIPARGSTIVAQVRQDGGQIAQRRTIDGTFTIPAVAYDSTADGLSHDGTTLALIEPRKAFPRANTRFALLDGSHLRVKENVLLKGDFSFDAISPDGSTMYLVQYLSPRDPTAYRVRAYDVEAGRLRPAPIVDPTDPDEMGGVPFARAASRDGRWAYTLYGRPKGHPFVHALDTVAGTARCIDLDFISANIGVSALRLNEAGDAATVMSGMEPVAEVDLVTFKAEAPTSVPADAVQVSDGRPWFVPLLAATGFVALLAGGVVVRLRLRKRVAGRGITTLEAGPKPPDPLLR
jgi:hypothetical protein